MLSKVWNGLTSIRLALLSLLLVALGSLLGTLLPQQQPWDYYHERFGGLLAEIFWRLGLSDIYRSPLFLTIIGLLILNLIACSLKRLPEVLRLFQTQPTLDSYKLLPKRLQLTLPRRDVSPTQFLDKTLHRTLGRPLMVQDQESYLVFIPTGTLGAFGTVSHPSEHYHYYSGGTCGKILGLSGPDEPPERPVWQCPDPH